MESVSANEARDQLRRILESKRFAKARKRSRFPEFVCEQALLGKGEELNEHLIGLEVYERRPDFDPQADAIVRVQACELRKVLKEFADEGRHDPWRIDLPAGHCVPVFTRHAELVGAGSPPPPPEGRPSWLRRNALVLALGLACAVLAFLWLRERSARPLARAASSLPSGAEWFWKPFLPPAAPPRITIPNHPILRAAHPGDSAATRERAHLIPKAQLPEFRDAIHFRELAGFYFVPSTTDFTSVGETLGLVNLFELFAAAGQRIQVKPGRLVDFASLKQRNAILLGGNQAWSGRIFLYPEGFWFHAGVITNKTPRANEQPVYRPEFDPVTNSLRRDYALVLMLPNQDPQRRILLIYGIYTQGSQAAIEYVTNPEHLEELQQRLRALTPGSTSPPNFFQVLLTTTVENAGPGRVSFVSARVIPQ